MSTRPALMIVSLLAAVLVPAGAAAAQTTFGDSLSEPAVEAPPSTADHVVEIPGDPEVYGAPSAGVVVEVRVKAGAGAAGRVVRPVVARAAENGDFTAAQVGGPRELGSSTITAFATRLPAAKDDRLALAVEGGEPLAVFRSSAGDVLRRVERSEPPASGDDLGAGTPAPGLAPLVQAVLEPDADADGFGDVTQDDCPEDPVTTGACTADLTLERGNACRTLCIYALPAGWTIYGFWARPVNLSPAVARGVAVHAELLRDGVLLYSRDCFVVGPRAACPVGDLARYAPPADRPFLLAASLGFTALSGSAAQIPPGPLTVRATISSSTPDPNPANNTLTQTVDVPLLPPEPKTPERVLPQPDLPTVRYPPARAVQLLGGGLRVTLTPQHDGTLVAGGYLRIGRSKAIRASRTVRRAVRNGRRTTVTVPFSRSTRARVARALRAGRRATLTLTTTITSAGGVRRSDQTLLGVSRPTRRR